MKFIFLLYKTTLPFSLLILMKDLDLFGLFGGLQVIGGKGKANWLSKEGNSSVYVAGCLREDAASGLA